MILGWFWNGFGMIWAWCWNDFEMIWEWCWDDLGMNLGWFLHYFGIILGLLSDYLGRRPSQGNAFPEFMWILWGGGERGRALPRPSKFAFQLLFYTAGYYIHCPGLLFFRRGASPECAAIGRRLGSAWTLRSVMCVIPRPEILINRYGGI